MPQVAQRLLLVRRQDDAVDVPGRGEGGSLWSVEAYAAGRAGAAGSRSCFDRPSAPSNKPTERLTNRPLHKHPAPQSSTTYLPPFVFECEPSKHSPEPGPGDGCSDLTTAKDCGREKGCQWCQGMIMQPQCFSEVRGSSVEGGGVGWIGVGEGSFQRGCEGTILGDCRHCNDQLHQPCQPHQPTNPPINPTNPTTNRPTHQPRQTSPPTPQARAKLLPPVVFKCDAARGDDAPAPAVGRKGGAADGRIAPA